ncbi:hypothetical protein [Thermomonospora umbrina]|uniref:Uncharacterized protein n=1 Tax=Thermomonospora umbrina TaxID=111806 RepID=A0A3D9SXX6_9ACTN|nr:hypothetical protein [Thermomonospora umbrina]REE96461.1 hypothetical protein DFJ69_1898 [Thermomonospora umbrina]
MGFLFARIVDDAALFPPARESLETALPAHRAAAGHPVLGRFLCPASKLDELRRHLLPEDLIDLGIIADTGLDDLGRAVDTARREPRVRLRSIELAPDPDADQARATAVTIARLPAGLPCHIEVRPRPGWRETLDRLAAARGHRTPLGAKLRTGGREGPPGGEYGPSPAEVAAFIAACAERDLPFKCTAGLHHAVRHVDDDTGLTHHGFLNVLLAACRARSRPDGADPAELADVLASTDAAALADEAAHVSEAVGRAARELFVAFGSCDVRTPRTDLIELGFSGEDGDP